MFRTQIALLFNNCYSQDNMDDVPLQIQSQLDPNMPNSNLTIEHEQNQHLASFIERVAAFLLEFIIFFPPLIYLIFLQAFSYTNRSSYLNVRLLFVLISFSIPIYNIISLAKYGTTLGKRLLKIKVVSASQNKLSLSQIIIRETIGRMISGSFAGLGYLWALWDEKKQTWHDKIANTYVVKDNSIVSRKKEAFIYLGIIAFYILLPVIFLLFYSRSIYLTGYPCGKNMIRYEDLNSALINKNSACYLDLSSKNLTSIPSNLFELKNLRILRLNNNQISEIPAEIENLNKLTHLYLADNILTDLPPQIVELKHLQEIELGNNQFSRFPTYLDSLKKLRIIGLESNPLIPGEKERIIENHPGMIINLVNIPPVSSTNNNEFSKDWIVYDASKAGYKISYPPLVFRLMHKDSEQVLILISHDNNLELRVIPSIKEGYSTLKDYYMNSPENINIYKNAQNLTEVQIAGLDGYTLYMESVEVIPQKIYSYKLLLKRDKYIYDFSLDSSDRASLIKNKDLFDQMIATIQLIEAE